MLNIGTPELLLVLLVGLVVLGPTKLPEVARQIGRAVAEIRRLGAGFQAEMRDAMQEPVRTEAQPSITPAETDDAKDGLDHGEVTGPDGDSHAGDGDVTAD